MLNQPDSGTYCERGRKVLKMVCFFAPKLKSFCNLGSFLRLFSVRKSVTAAQLLCRAASHRPLQEVLLLDPRWWQRSGELALLAVCTASSIPPDPIKRTRGRHSSPFLQASENSKGRNLASQTSCMSSIQMPKKQPAGSEGRWRVLGFVQFRLSLE